MRLSRTIVFLLSGLLVSFTLFAQAAFATRPCVEAGMSAMAQHDADGCCETMMSVTNLCVAKCADGDKLSGHANIVIPAPSDEPIFIVEIPAVTLPDAQLWLARSGLDPPKTIRFCSFLI